jgi:predicted transcriptional regulator
VIRCATTSISPAAPRWSPARAEASNILVPTPRARSARPERNASAPSAAAHTARSRSYRAAEAIAEYDDNDAWQVEEIRKAVERADAGGPFVAHDDVEKYAETLARGEKPRRPKTFTRR